MEIHQNIKENANGGKSISIEITGGIKSKVLGEVARLLIDNISTKILPVIAREIVCAMAALEETVEEHAKKEGLE